MRRRDFIKGLCGAALAGQAVPAKAAGGADARYARTFVQIKREYAKVLRPSEAARAVYITRLVRLREQATRIKGDTWQDIDAEIMQHPAPSDSDSKALSGLLVGQWSSPRHDYVYRADGTWTLLPAEPDATHGRWRIDGNQYFDSVATDPPVDSRYSIILISSRYFVFADQTNIFYENRLK
jgi:hypothetical protein